MTQEELNQIARDIVKNNIYLTLATTDGKNPWSATLFYCADDKYNFYYISRMDCFHTKHILLNPRVAFSIFDSHAPEGKGNGVQVSGKAYLLEKEKDIEEALKHYHTSFIKCDPKDFTGSKSHRLFKIVPEKFFVLDPEAEVDKRVEVRL